MRVKEESEKTNLNLNIQKNKIMASSRSLHGKQMGGKWKQRQTFFSGAVKSLLMVTASMKLEDTCSLVENYDKPREYIKTQRHHSVNKGPFGQSYDFSSDHIWV